MAIEDSSPKPNRDELPKKVVQEPFSKEGENNPLSPLEKFMQRTTEGPLGILSLGDKESDEKKEKTRKKKRKQKRNWLRRVGLAESEPVKPGENEVFEPETKEPGFLTAFFDSLKPKDDQESIEYIAEDEVVEDSATPAAPVESVTTGLAGGENIHTGHREMAIRDADSNSQAEISNITEAEIPLATEGTPESIHTILKRQQATANTGDFVSLPPVYEQTVSNGNNNVEKATTNIVNNYYERDRRTTNALVVLDVMNYGIARHRDTKKEKAAIKRETKIKDTNEQQHKEMQYRINQQELYQEQLKRRAEKLEKNQQMGRLPKVRQAEFRTRELENSPEISPNVVNSTTNNIALNRRAEINNHIQPSEITTSLPERPIVRAPDVALPSAETIFHKVEQAAEHGEAIETQYELRHERKGNTDFQAFEEMHGTVTGFKQPQYSHDNRLTDINLPTAPPKDHKAKGGYKQAATTGIWGAVVGIIIFIVFYILTRR